MIAHWHETWSSLSVNLNMYINLNFYNRMCLSNIVEIFDLHILFSLVNLQIL